MPYSEVRCGFETYLDIDIAQEVESPPAENPFFYHYAQVRISLMLLFLFHHLYCIIFFICILQSYLDNTFNIDTKCLLNGTLANTKTHMRDATECINSIGYGLFSVIKVIFSNRNDLEFIVKYFQKNCINIIYNNINKNKNKKNNNKVG